MTSEGNSEPPLISEDESERPLLRNRVSRRIFGLFVGCALVPLTALSVLSYIHISQTLHSDAGKVLRQSCKATGMTVFERLLLLEQDIEGVVSRLEVSDQASLARAILPTRKRIETKFEQIGLYSASGELLSEFGQAPENVDLTEAELQHLEQKKILLRTRPTRNGWGDVLLVRICNTAPVVQNDSVFLVAQIRRSHLWGGDLLSPDIEFVSLDEHNRVIYSTKPEITAREVEEHFGADQIGVFDWSDENRDYLANSWPLFMLPQFRTSWKLIYSQTKDEVLAPLYNFRKLFLLFALLSLFIVILLSISQIRKRLMPIQKLLLATEKLGSMDFDCKVSIYSNDEFEKLGRAFNVTVDRLATNVKERDRFEHQLIAARDQALASAQTEALFIANVSHELRTPMTSIRAFAEILKDHDAEDQQTREEFLDIIVAESDRLTRLIENVLDLTKIHSLAEPEFEVIDVAQTIVAICMAMSVVATDRGITIDHSGVCGPLWADGDQDRLKQVWTNLISNATKFAPENSVVRVRGYRENDSIVVEVSDQGPGISKKDQSVIFERFRQVTSDVVTNKPAGTGLGLTIVKEIVQLHRGAIHVDSKPGEGATFSVVLPLSYQILTELPELTVD